MTEAQLALLADTRCDRMRALVENYLDQMGGHRS